MKGLTEIERMNYEAYLKAKKVRADMRLALIEKAIYRIVVSAALVLLGLCVIAIWLS